MQAWQGFIQDFWFGGKVASDSAGSTLSVLAVELVHSLTTWW